MTNNASTTVEERHAGNVEAKSDQIAQVVRMVGTTAGLLYLLAVVSGWIPTRLETSDLVLVAVLVVWNSRLLDKITEFDLTKEGLSLKTKVEAQGEKLDGHEEKLTEQQQKLARQQTLLQTQQDELAKLQRKQQELLASVTLNLLTDGERVHLKRLRESKEKGVPFDYRYRREMLHELDRLGGLRFIRNVEGGGIHRLERMTDGQPGDLTADFYITDEGIKYLDRCREIDATTG